MDDQCIKLMKQFVPGTYVDSGAASLRTRNKLLRQLLSQRRLPDVGWEDSTIVWMLETLSRMDSNNFDGSAGLGEREGRVSSGLVARRHWGLAHGIGRSGDIAAVQPKAAGSSLLAQLTHALVLDAIKLAGVRAAKAAIVLPVATGMALLLTLITMRKRRPAGARYVVWPRIDQKSCFKAILSAGFTPVVIENVFEGDELRTDVAAVEAKLRELGVENVLAVVTTTSCFAPRGIDRIADVGRLCAELDVGHVVNNAYGLQSKRCCNLISEAMVAKDGRLDAFVSSTDKNFCVPVGGSCVVSPSKEFIVAVGRAYPGRASIAPLLDVLITMLHWGRTGYATLLRQREELMPYLRARLEEVAAEAGERVLDTPHNPISMGLTLDAQLAAGADRAALTEIGAMLFKRNISGCRVVVPGAEKEIEGHSFVGYGGHTDAYPHAYITAACSIGLSRDDVDSFTKTLSKTLSAFRKKKRGGEVE